MTASEVGEAEDIYNVAVVTSEWVRLCLQWGKYQYIKAFHPSVRLLFSQVKVYIFNICKEDKDTLKGYIRVFGGSVADSLSEEVTHVVIGTIEGEAHEEILSQCSIKMTIVTPNWIIECINNRSMQATVSFQPQVIYDQLKSLQISSENERTNQTKKAVMAPPPLTESSKRPSESVVTVCTSAQFTLSGLQQAVPISIQDSLLTRQLPSNISSRLEASYQLPPRTMSIQNPKVPNVTTSSLTSSNAISVPTTTTKSKSSKNNNKHLQEQGLNEMEKEAIVMQNVISILGKRTTSTTNVIEKSSFSNSAARKPRSPRPKINRNQTSTAASISSVPSKSTTQSSLVNPPSNVIITETKNEPKSPQHSISTNPRYGNPQSSRPQSILNRSLETQVDNPDIDQSGHTNQMLSKPPTTISSSTSSVQMCNVSSQAPFQNIFLQHQQQQQILDQSGHVSQLHNRQLQRQFQQQQHRQLITLGQIQAPPGQQPQQWQHNTLHMSPNQHTSPSAAGSHLSSPGQPQGICATVPQTSSVHQMYQLQHQLNSQPTNYYRWISQLPRTGIINNGNQMMLNNMSGNLPLNTSMVANVATPLHLQSSVGNGNPATIMLHQQQLHVASNLPQSALHSPNGGQGTGPLTMTSGKILSGAIPRAVLQHSPQLSGVVRVPNNSYSMLQSNHHGMLQNGSVTDHNTHHSTSGPHLNRPLANMLRLPQYVGNEGMTSGICRENCLIGCVFFLYGYEEVSQVKKDGWLSSIRSHGGETVTTFYHQVVTHLIVDCQLNDPNLFKMALKYKTRVVTIYWVNDVIDKGHLEPPFEIIHLPSPFSKNLSFSYIKRQIVSITGFEGEERKKMEYMAINLGVKYTEYLEASNTVLICKKIFGRKYEAAQKMGIACVNVRWLQDLYFGDLSTLSADIEHKYQSFEPADVSIRLERMTPRVQELMVGWIVPVRLDEASWKKYRVLKEQFEIEKNTRKRQAEASSIQSSVNAKKLKWQLPSLSNEDMELADLCALKQLRLSVPSSQDNNNEEIKFENNDTIDDLLQQNENQQRIFVAFTGLLPEQRDKLADLVASLGGQVTDDMMQCTHLVAKNIIRTPKFYYGVLRGCQIVTMKWVQACAYRQQFIDETPWKLEDKEGERQFGFSLDMSLQRARSRVNNHIPPLFQSLEFFLSPRAKHRQICMDLIRASGGIIREKRPIQKMALMTEPRHLIICHEDDSHLANYLTRTKTGNKAVHHEEFVLSCVMRQELDFDSYQIQYVSVIKNAFNNQSSTITNALETTTPNRDSPSRSAVSDSTVDTADTHTSQHTEPIIQPLETSIQHISSHVENMTGISISTMEKFLPVSAVVKVEKSENNLERYVTEVTSYVEPALSQVKMESLTPTEDIITSKVQKDVNILL